MNIANSVDELRAVVAGWRRAGETISFVPTMGNLHDGHITLLLKARELATRSVVSIFVNPIQFGRGEDYAKYPSTLESDKQKLQAAGLDLLFAQRPTRREAFFAWSTVTITISVAITSTTTVVSVITVVATTTVVIATVVVVLWR
jgi:pantoate--beta-alanine ligase